MSKRKIHKMTIRTARREKLARRDFETGIDWQAIATKNEKIQSKQESK